MSPLLFSLLLLPLISSTNPQTHFLEAPLFLNSPQCEDPSAINDINKNQYCCRDDVINIAMTLDHAYLRGSMAAILSIIHHSSCPQNLYFHFIHSQTQDSNLNSTIFNSFPSLQFSMYPFDEETVTRRISTSVRRALDRPLNYARSYLARLLPDCISRVIYLDSDVIVVDDIGMLWSTQFVSTDSVIAAPEYCHTDMSRYYSIMVWSFSWDFHLSIRIFLLR